MLRSARFKQAAAVAVIALLAAAGVALAALRSASNDELRSYYYEARVGDSTVQAWYDEGERRIELHRQDRSSPDEPSVFVVRDRLVQYYESSSAYYWEFEAPKSLEDWRTWLRVEFLGPSAGAAERIAATFNGCDDSWEAAGSERLLGRQARVFEARRSSSVGDEQHEGRYWLDAEYGFLLRMEFSESDEEPAAEIVELVLNQPVDADLFEFEAPVGALLQAEMDPAIARGLGLADARDEPVPDVPAGYLSPGYLPGNYALSRVQVRPAGGLLDSDNLSVCIRAEASGTDHPLDAFLLIKQVRGDGVVPEELQAGEPVSVAGSEAYRLEDDEETRLVWAQDELVVVMRSDELPYEELLRVAEAMQAQP